MNNRPLISVVTATYNDERFIKRCVDSILQQSYTNIEYIIVDDGSTDSTPTILEQLRLSDHRIVLITQKNAGAAAARNAAFRVAKGDYIAIQDSDDTSSLDRLEKQFNHLSTANDYVISCTGHTLIDEEDNVFARHNKVYTNINQNVLKGNTSVCHASMLVPSKLIHKTGGYNPFYKKTEDYDLIFRLLEHNGRFDKVNECLYNYRIRENSESALAVDVYMKRVYENHLNRINNRPENFDEIIKAEHVEQISATKRRARGIFFTEDYSAYRRFYLTNFFKLPLNDYFLLLIYSLLPLSIKLTLKEMYNRKSL